MAFKILKERERLLALNSSYIIRTQFIISFCDATSKKLLYILLLYVKRRGEEK